jgi:hypothetical protein
MSTENVKILLRRGFRDEIASTTLDTGEPGFATDTNQLFIGIDSAINEVVFDTFANAQAIVQSWLDTYSAEPGLIIDEDLVIRDVLNVDALLDAMITDSAFNVANFARSRENVEVITENSFNQLFADQHLSSLDSSLGIRPSLSRKSLTTETGTFLRYNKGVCTTFFIDYSLVQTDGTSKFLRVGQIKVINGVPQGINQVKLTDDNTEIWQDDTDGIAEVDEFSNIEFDTAINGDNIEINFTQGAGFETEISYTVKRWSM